MIGIVRPVWNFRGFILGSVKREFQSKYRRSMLGGAWTIIQPLSMIVVYTLIFSQIMQARLPGVESPFAYSIYLCAGIITWGLFAEIVSRSQTMFIENANLLKKVSFPRLCLPVILSLNALVNFVLIFGLFIVFLVAVGAFPGWAMLAMIPLLVIQLLFSLGLGVSLGILNVFFRDVGQTVTVVLFFWFWLTPIVYPAAILPDRVEAMLRYNPMYPLMSAYQDIMVYAQAPDWGSLWPVTLAGIVLCALGVRLFLRRAGEMVDEL
ncbi:ABC transporter permease [Thioalkalivibrio thiocyanodenitrificans]|uniref:ABC transporter permease n=1 Tax=Thioalkalivibrio thiocyanodenitrificans TaxID=243063 RepID=UPI00036EBF9B|nr:ABC transporter permease [Thioalkalivibrio thiocyanodenitrificans]